MSLQFVGRPITPYVAGFLFRGPSIPEAASVALVRKLKPKWQLGLWNGIGGKVEKGESQAAAMRREALEEIGLPVSVDWNYFHTEEGRDYAVSFWRALVPEGFVLPVENDAGEACDWVGTSLAPDPNRQVVGNLRWLVPMAQDWRRMDGHTRATDDDISSRPSW